MRRRSATVAIVGALLGVATLALDACEEDRRGGQPAASVASAAPAPRAPSHRAPVPLGPPASPPDLGAWEEAPPPGDPASDPGPRSGHAMVYETRRGVTLLFGGESSTSLLRDSWEWNGSVWSLTCAGDSCLLGTPPARYAFAMAYDDLRGVAVLFGGQGNGELLSDTWEWDGISWQERCTTRPCLPPDPRFGHAMAFDRTRGKVVLYGGRSCADPGACVDLEDTWEWDGSVWTQPPTALSWPGKRAGHAMAFDETLGPGGATVLFGGVEKVALGDTWAWDGTTWTEICATCPPPPRAYGALAYDVIREKLVLFGGSEAASDTWDFDGALWAPLSTSGGPAPSARTAHAMAYDVSRRRLVVYGGASGGATLDDVWEQHRYAGGCGGDAECETSLCADGVCCASTCGVCETCRTGTCAVVTSGPDPSCPGTCDADGRCLKGPGAACASRDECASTFCVDGVCCDSSCDGVCHACLGALTKGGTDGHCDVVTRSTDPHDDCADQGACSCGLDGVCDARGACEQYAAGTGCVCGDPGRALFDYQCNGFGACAAPLAGETKCDGDHLLAFADGGAASCGAFRCEAAPSPHCLTSCASSEDCAAPATCGAGGLCESPPAAPTGDQAPGCAAAPRRSRSGLALAPFVLAGLLGALVRRRRRSP